MNGSCKHSSLQLCSIHSCSKKFKAKVQAQWVYFIESFAAVIYNFGIYGNCVLNLYMLLCLIFVGLLEVYTTERSTESSLSRPKRAEHYE
jgi:hypothetical protein